jgi:hypothetical protein
MILISDQVAPTHNNLLTLAVDMVVGNIFPVYFIDKMKIWCATHNLEIFGIDFVKTILGYGV